MITRRNFLKTAILGTCALSVPVLAKTDYQLFMEARPQLIKALSTNPLFHGGNVLVDGVTLKTPIT